MIIFGGQLDGIGSGSRFPIDWLCTTWFMLDYLRYVELGSVLDLSG